MSRIGQFVQQLQEGESEKFEPDPLYDEREIQKILDNDPGYHEFNQEHSKPLTTTRKVKW